MPNIYLRGEENLLANSKLYLSLSLHTRTHTHTLSPLSLFFFFIFFYSYIFPFTSLPFCFNFILFYFILFYCSLASFVRTQLLSIVAVMFKRSWVDEKDNDESRAMFMSQLQQLLAADTEIVCRAFWRPFFSFLFFVPPFSFPKFGWEHVPITALIFAPLSIENCCIESDVSYNNGIWVYAKIQRSWPSLGAAYCEQGLVQVIATPKLRNIRNFLWLC